MFRNYLLTAVRHLTRHKGFALINILCLSVGIVFSLVITIYVQQEKTINNHLRHAQNQCILKCSWKGQPAPLEFTSFWPLAKALREEYPELVAGYYRYMPYSGIVSANKRIFKEAIAVGDTSLVSMYDFPVLYGDKHRAFTDKNCAVITESLAMKLFDRKDVMNEGIHVQQGGYKTLYRISAVLKDYPYNSVTGLMKENYRVFVPMEMRRTAMEMQGTKMVATETLITGGWEGAAAIGLVELQPGVPADRLQKPMQALARKYMTAEWAKQVVMEAAPLQTFYETAHNGKVSKMLQTLSLIAFFIMAMAVINFININTGLSGYRVREIGVRKVLGGSKTAIVLQYLLEAMLLTLLSGLIALAGYEALYRQACQLLNTTLPHIWQLPVLQAGVLLALLSVVGLLAGLYPALIAGSVNTILSVKGLAGSVQKGLLLRKSFLTLQFAVAIAVFICTVMISRQVKYIFAKDLGYRKEQVLVIHSLPQQADSLKIQRMEGIKKVLLASPAVKSVSLCYEIPDRLPTIHLPLSREGNKNAPYVTVAGIEADESYATTFGIALKEGEFFTRPGADYVPDQMVLNEAAVKALSLAEPVTGKIVYLDRTIPYRIAGVVKDYHYSSLTEKIAPQVFTHVKEHKSYRFLSVKLNTTNSAAALASVQQAWKQAAPDAPFDYFFMEDKFSALYQSELQLQNASRLATLLNIVIVLMGIVGVVAFTIAKRTKEVAVRKILGAKVWGILLLFMREYFGLFVIANLIAWPMAYYFSHQWLAGYAYRIPVSMGAFVLAALVVFAGMMALIGLQCLRIARANPAVSLRVD